jgi:transcriptional regulator with XRE-family HTH domain
VTPSELLKDARERAGLTQAALAQRLGKSQASVAALERQGANPTVATLSRVLSATGYELDLRLAPVREQVDTVQIEAQLDIAPAERLRGHTAARRNVRRLLDARR